MKGLELDCSVKINREREAPLEDEKYDSFDLYKILRM